MKKIILLSLFAVQSAFASKDILPPVKNDREIASQESPKLEGTRVLMTNRTWEVTPACYFKRGNTSTHIKTYPKVAVSCNDSGVEMRLINKKIEIVGKDTDKIYLNLNYKHGAVDSNCFSAVEGIRIKNNGSKESCYSEAVELGSVQQYIDYQIKTKLAEYLNLVDRKTAENFVQATRDPEFQKYMHGEAKRSVDSYMKIKNQ